MDRDGRIFLDCWAEMERVRPTAPDVPVPEEWLFPVLAAGEARAAAARVPLWIPVHLTGSVLRSGRMDCPLAPIIQINRRRSGAAQTIRLLGSLSKDRQKSGGEASAARRRMALILAALVSISRSDEGMKDRLRPLVASHVLALGRESENEIWSLTSRHTLPLTRPRTDRPSACAPMEVIARFVWDWLMEISETLRPAYLTPLAAQERFRPPLESFQNLATTLEPPVSPEPANAAWEQLRTKDLSRLVWEMPLPRIAQRFDVSPQRLVRECRRRGIERPGYGYWTKARLAEERSDTGDRGE